MNTLIKKSSLIFIIAMLVTVSVSSNFNQFASASTNANSDIKDIEKEIDYIYENIIILDENNNLIDINTKNAEDYYGYIPEELIKLEDNIKNLNDNSNTITPFFTGYDNAHQCTVEEVKNSFGSLIPEGIIAAVLEGTVDKTQIMKDLARMGVKGNIIGIAAQLIYIESRCTINHGPFL